MDGDHPVGEDHQGGPGWRTGEAPVLSREQGALRSMDSRARHHKAGKGPLQCSEGSLQEKFPERGGVGS